MARSPRVWLIDIRGEISGIWDLTKDADLAAFSESWAMKRAVEHAPFVTDGGHYILDCALGAPA